MFRTFVFRRPVTKFSGENNVGSFKAEFWKSKHSVSPRHWYQPFRYGFGWYQPTTLNCCCIMLKCQRREYLKLYAIRVDVHTWPVIPIFIRSKLWNVNLQSAIFGATDLLCSILCSVDCASLYNLSKWSQLGAHYFWVYLFQLLYIFRAIVCPSSGELTVSMRHWYFSFCMGGCLVCRPDSQPYSVA